MQFAIGGGPGSGFGDTGGQAGPDHSEAEQFCLRRDDFVVQLRKKWRVASDNEDCKSPGGKHRQMCLGGGVTPAYWWSFDHAMPSAGAPLLARATAEPDVTVTQ